VNESLSLAIRHHTGFTYDGIAKSSYNEARMTPISGASQEVRNAHIAVQPVVPLSTHTDYFGTVVTAFDIQEPHPKLEVEARSNVESRAGLIAPRSPGAIYERRRSSTSSRSTCSQLTGPS